MIKDQTDARQNGIYVVSQEGAPTRYTAADMKANTIFYVSQGIINHETLWKVVGTFTGPGGAPVYGTDAINFVPVTLTPGGGGNVNLLGTAPIVVTNPSAGTYGISFAPSGVTAGTYNTLTVDAQGIVTFGTNVPYSGSGTVTDVSTDNTLVGGPITTTGTLGLNLNNANIWTAEQSFYGNASLGNGNYLMFNGSADTNWRIGIIDVLSTHIVGSTSSIQLITGAGTAGPDGFAIGNTNGISNLEVNGTTGQLWVRGPVQMANYGSGIATFDSSGNITSSILGSNLQITGGTLNVVGITGGTGTVTAIYTGTGLVESATPITNSGTIAMADSGVTAGTYGNGSNIAQITVDALGRVLSATNIPVGSVGFTWNNVAGNTQAMAPQNGYIATNAALTTMTLPTTCAFGQIIAVASNNIGGWQIAQNSGQTIHFGNQNTTTGNAGFLASNNKYDYVELLCIVANTDFMVKASVGDITVL